MSIDKRVHKEDRKPIEKMNEICGGVFNLVQMTHPSVKKYLYNFNKEGRINILGFDFATGDINEDKLKLIGEQVKKLKNIERFIIFRTKEKIFLDWFKDINYIKGLEIRFSFLTEIPDFLKEFKNLEEIDLTRHEIVNLPKWLPSLPKLKKFFIWSRNGTLELNKNNIDILKALHDKDVEIRDSIHKMCVDLELPKDQAEIIRSIRNIKGENIVFGRSLDTYSQKERDTNLQHNFFELNAIELRTIDKKIAQMAISEFDLEGLPESFGKINGLKKLLLYNNSLKSLPESFGELTELKELDLSKNELTSLPDSFVNLTSIKKLNLSNNKFTEIPTQLWSLKELTDLNLSGNPLDDENMTISQKVPDLIREYLRKKATIKIFISHAVIDFEPYHIKELVEYLEKQKDISQVFFCEEDLAGNIDEWMLDNVQKSQLILFIATQKSVFNSLDCANELQLADKFSIPVIPLKGDDVNWQDLAEIKLSRELGLEYDKKDFNSFLENLYTYIENFKQEIDLMDKDNRAKSIMDIYERFRLMLDERLSEIIRRIEKLENK